MSMDARKLASAPKASASSGGGSSGGVAGELHDLQAMHNDGTLSDDEFHWLTRRAPTLSLSARSVLAPRDGGVPERD